MPKKGLVDCWMNSLNNFNPNNITKIVKGMMNKGNKHWASTLYHFVTLCLIAAPVCYALHISGVLPFRSLCGTVYEKVPGMALFLTAGLMAIGGASVACATYCSANFVCALALNGVAVSCWMMYCKPALAALMAGVFSVNTVGMFVGCSVLVMPSFIFAAMHCLKGANPVAAVVKGITTNVFHYPLTTVLTTVLMTALMLPLQVFTIFAGNDVIKYCNRVSKVCCNQLPPMFCPGLVLKYALCFMIAMYAVSLYAEVAERAKD